METRKIALIIFLISLIFLSLGVVVYVARQRSEVNTLQTNKLSTPVGQTTPKASNNSNTASSTDVVNNEGKPITEEEIKAGIEAKKAQISKEAKGRDYTSEEINFMLFPRQVVIDELKKK